MKAGLFFLLVVSPIVLTTVAGNSCCFPDYFQGRQWIVGENINIYYRVDYTRRLMYRTYDADGATYNVTDFDSKVHYVVNADGCTKMAAAYTDWFFQCKGNPTKTLGFGTSANSFPVSYYEKKEGDLTVTSLVYNYYGFCIPYYSTTEIAGSISRHYIFFYEDDAPQPPAFGAVKALCD